MASLACCYIPKIWRYAWVTFIPKPGKMDYTTAKSFQPICLTSFLLKGLDGIVFFFHDPLHLRCHPLAEYVRIPAALQQQEPCHSMIFKPLGQPCAFSSSTSKDCQLQSAPLQTNIMLTLSACRKPTLTLMWHVSLFMAPTLSALTYMPNMNELCTLETA